MLETLLHALKGILRFDWWFSGRRHVIPEYLIDEQIEHQHNKKWSEAFLEQKRLERTQRPRGQRVAPQGQSQERLPITLGRPKRKP